MYTKSLFKPTLSPCSSPRHSTGHNPLLTAIPIGTRNDVTNGAWWPLSMSKRAKCMSCAKEMSCLCKFIFNNWLSRVVSSWKHITRIITMFKHRPIIWIKSNITLRLQPRSSVNFSETVDSPALAKQPFVSLGWHQRSHQVLGWANSFPQAAVVLHPTGWLHLSHCIFGCIFHVAIACLIFGNAFESTISGAPWVSFKLPSSAAKSAM